MSDYLVEEIKHAKAPRPLQRPVLQSKARESDQNRRSVRAETSVSLTNTVSPT